MAVTVFKQIAEMIYSTINAILTDNFHVAVAQVNKQFENHELDNGPQPDNVAACMLRDLTPSQAPP